MASPSSPQPIFQIRDLSKSYGPKQVLRRVSFDILPTTPTDFRLVNSGNGLKQADGGFGTLRGDDKITFTFCEVSRSHDPITTI